MVLLSASVSSSESTHDGDNVQSGRVRAWDWTEWKIHALPSPSTLSEYPLQVPAAKVGRGASAGQGSRRGRLLRAQASEVSPPDKLESLVCWMSERCKQGHTCHVAAKRRSRYKNHLARRSGLIVSASIQRAVSIVWSRTPSVLLFASLRLHFPLACN